MNFKFITRELKAGKFQFLIFLLCLILSVSLIVSLDGFRSNIQDNIDKDSKALVGGDIKISANKPYSENLTNAINNVKTNYIDSQFVNTLEFASIVYSKKTNSSVLASIKAVDNIYPLYGDLILKNNSSNNIEENFFLAEENLATRLNIQIGDKIEIGNTTLILKDFILKEPDRPFSLFSLGPRIIISSKDLEKTGLIGEKSRVEYETYIKTSQIDEIYQILDEQKGERERVRKFEQVETRISNYISNFIFFISFVTLFTILLGGFGLSMTLLSAIRTKKKNIAITRILGMQSREILIHYFALTMILAVIGTIIGIAIGLLLELYLPQIFENLLGFQIDFTFKISSVIRGFLMGILLTVFFTILPLSKLSQISPVSILRKDESAFTYKKKEIIATIILIFIFFVFLVFSQLNEFLLSVYFILGILAFFLIIILLVKLTFTLFKYLHKKINFISFKQFIRGILRPGNSSLLIIASISCALTILFSIYLVELNLNEQFITSFPKDSPNVFFVDIQKNQIEGFKQIVEDNTLTFYPSIRAPVRSINDIPISEIEKKLGPGEPITRDFSLTYTNNLYDGEKIIDSEEENSMFVKNWQNDDIVQVSALEEIANRMQLNLGDILVFSIQGIEIKAQIVSIRQRKEEAGFSPFFYFVFEPQVLETAPQTIFTALNIEKEKIPIIQNKLAQEYPGITTIDTTLIVENIYDIVSKLSRVIEFFTVFSIIGGILIFISSILVTGFERLKEAVLYKLVGASNFFIIKVFTLEFAFLGIISSIISIFLSNLATFIIAKYVLEIDFIFVFAKLIYISFTITLLFILIGLIVSIPVIRKRPVEYLKESRVE